MRKYYSFQYCGLLIGFLLVSSSFHAQCVPAPVPNNSCYQMVILADDFCCFWDWDNVCQDAYNDCFGGGSGTPTTGDCEGAIPICTNDLAFSIDPNGYGAIDELCVGCTSNPLTNPASGNDGCLQSGELNSTWFSLAVVAGGTLQFSFGSNGGGSNCYDWIMWPYNASACANIDAGTHAPIRCNWNFPCESFTGLGTPPPAGGEPGNFEPTLNVVAGQQFLICLSNYSSAITSLPLNFYGTANIQCIPLSVEFDEFTADAQRGYNFLQWSTTSEINCDYYEVQRSRNGSEFEKIGVVDGHGTTLEPSAYKYEDYSYTDEITYYRLKQVDFNGEAHYSSILVVTQEVPETFEIVKVYPNPAEDQLNVHFYLPQSAKATVIVSGLNGRELYRETSYYGKGGTIVQLDVQDYQPGLYMVTILDEETHNRDVVNVSVR